MMSKHQWICKGDVEGVCHILLSEQMKKINAESIPNKCIVFLNSMKKSKKSKTSIKIERKKTCKLCSLMIMIFLRIAKNITRKK